MADENNDPIEKSATEEIDLFKDVDLPEEEGSSEKALVPFDPLDRKSVV